MVDSVPSIKLILYMITMAHCLLKFAETGYWYTEKIIKECDDIIHFIISCYYNSSASRQSSLADESLARREYFTSRDTSLNYLQNWSLKDSRVKLQSVTELRLLAAMGSRYNSRTCNLTTAKYEV